MMNISKNNGAKAADAENNNVLEFGETLRELRKNVDPQLIRRRKGWLGQAGHVTTLDYVEWHTVADILDTAAPSWGHSIKAVRQIGDIIAVTVAITIDGVTREGIGTGSSLTETGIKRAEHDALKRAAVKFGIARELYKKEVGQTADINSEDMALGQSQDNAFPSNPVAAALSDLITAKQLGMIRAIGRESEIGTEEECERLLKCGTAELSRRAASSFIDHLLRSQKHASVLPPLRRAG